MRYADQTESHGDVFRVQLSLIRARVRRNAVEEKCRRFCDYSTVTRPSPLTSALHIVESGTPRNVRRGDYKFTPTWIYARDNPIEPRAARRYMQNEAVRNVRNLNFESCLFRGVSERSASTFVNSPAEQSSPSRRLIPNGTNV